MSFGERYRDRERGRERGGGREGEMGGGAKKQGVGQIGKTVRVGES